MAKTEKQIRDAIDDAIATYKGPGNELELAIGAMTLARHLGWKPLFLMHDKKTIRKFEAILGLEFRDAVAEEGELAHRSVAWKVFQKYNNFWKAVSGAINGVRTNMLNDNKGL